MATIPARAVASPTVETPKPAAPSLSLEPGLLGALTPARVLALQRTVGNRAVGNWLARAGQIEEAQEQASSHPNKP